MAEQAYRGERGVVQLLAVDQDQAKVCFGFTLAFFEMPMLAKMVRRITADSIELKNNLTIEITTNDKRRVRGRTVVAAISMRWRTGGTRPRPTRMRMFTRQLAGEFDHPQCADDRH